MYSEVSSIRSGRSIGRIAQTRQAAPSAGRCDCLGTTLCLPEAEGTGLFLRIVDLQVVSRSHTPALRRSRASGAAQTEPLQTPQDPAAGRTATAQDSILRGEKLRLRVRRIVQAVTDRGTAAVCCGKARQQLRPFNHWSICPETSMAPGRRLNIGEALGALR